MNKYTLGLIVLIIVLFMSIMEAHSPVLTVKFPITDAVTIKVSVYDDKQGLTSMVIANIKSALECLRGI